LAQYQPFQIIGYHSCDKDIGLKILNGDAELKPSHNDWDWLGDGVYFWEQNPKRALDYAIESANGKQFNKIRIKTPFVLGAIIQLGNCLNLIESDSLLILDEAYKGLSSLYNETGKKMPVNKDNVRKLDCAVIRYVHQSALTKNIKYDSVRSAFSEGRKVYPDASFSTRHHIQVCVINPELIKGYFLPLPHKEYNPYLNTKFYPST
jgi:hypothetical protein